MFLRDLHLCRAGLEDGRVDPATLRKALQGPGDEACSLGERLAASGRVSRRTLEGIASASWPDGPLDPDLVFLAIGEARGLVAPEVVVDALLGRDSRGGIRRAAAERAGIAESDRRELDRLTDLVLSDYELVRTAEPENIRAPFLRFLRIGIEARLLAEEAVLELLRWFHAGGDAGRIRTWLSSSQGMDPEQAQALVTKYFSGGGGSGGTVVGEAASGVRTVAGEGGSPSEAKALAREAASLERALAAGNRPSGLRPSTRKKGVRSEAPTVAVPEKECLLPPGAPRTVGGYELLAELGRGGMGVVYRARQAGLERQVALKLLALGESADPDWVKRFLREARAAARLQHPNVVRVYDVGTDGDRYYFAMDLIEGSSLASWVARKAVDPRGAARIAATIARALHAAHEKGIVHRDVKPSNILLDREGTPFLTDFGLALDVRGASVGLTQTGATLGTPPYMPPEQVHAGAGKIDARSDVYSLGATLYEALAGRAPFEGNGVLEIARKVLSEDPTSVREFNPALPRDLSTIVEKAMDKSPRRRYPTALAMAEDLDRFLEGVPVLARRITRVERTWRWILRRKALAVAVASTLVLALAGLALGLGSLLRYLSYREAMSDGSDALEGGDFEVASASFERALDVYPDDAVAGGKLAETRRRARERKELPLATRSGRLLAPGGWDAEVARDVEAEAAGVVLAFPESQIARDVLSQIATARSVRKRIEVAERIQRGANAVRDGEFPLAARLFQDALDRDPGLDAIRLYLCLARFRAAEGRGGSEGVELVRGAIDAVTPIVEKFTSNWALRVVRSILYFRIEETDAALDDLSLSLSVLWRQLEVQENLGFPGWARSVRSGDPAKMLNFAFEAPLAEMVSLTRVDLGGAGPTPGEAGVSGVGEAIDQERIRSELVLVAREMLDDLQETIHQRLGFLANPVGAAGMMASASGDRLGRFLVEAARYHALMDRADAGRTLLSTLPALIKKIEVDPIEAELALGDLALASGDPIEEARTHFERALDRAPGSPRVQVRHLWFLFREADRAVAVAPLRTGYNRALARVEELLAARPDDPELLLAKGVALFHLSAFQPAAEALAAARDRFAMTDPGRADVHVYLAAAMEKLLRPREAEGVWERAVSLDPGAAYLEAWIRRERLIVPFGTDRFEVELEREASDQMAYAEEAGDRAEKAARLQPVLYYHFRTDPYRACLAAIRLCDLSVRLGRTKEHQVFRNLVTKGFREEPHLGDFCPSIADYFKGWTDDEMTTYVRETGGRNVDLAAYLLGLSWEVVREDRADHLQVAAERYREALEGPVQNEFVRTWAQEALGKLK